MSRGNRLHEGGRLRRSARVATPRLPALMALAWLLAGEAHPAAALHYVQEGLGCYICHTLDQDEADTATSFIGRGSRTMTAMKTANGGTTPAQFGCTYCHDIGSRERMRPVLAHFEGKASMHPVGKNFVTGANTDREYLSSWNSAFQGELDCVDCHDVEGQGDGRDDTSTPQDESADHDPATSALSAEFGSKYPEHGPPAHSWNPFMLRGVTALNQYDPLCLTCHGSAAPLVKGTSPVDNDQRLDPATAHADGVPTGSGGSGPIVEDDGTLLKTTAGGGNDQCRACHDTHYSNRQRLFNDGHERIGGTGAPETPIDISNCTGTCHFAGDQFDNFDTHGHGKAVASSGKPLAFNCTNCHSVDALHNSTFPSTDPRAAKMLSATPGTAPSNLTGKSLNSVCTTCHNNYAAHRGTVGCLDCHDEHAEGSGTSNIAMIPQRLPNRTSGVTETVVFGHSGAGDYDFYISDNAAPHQAGAGVCDNGVCHATVSSGNGTPLAPLSGLMTGVNHTGGAQSPLSDCGSCHKHDDSAGSWGAAGN